MQCKNTSSRSSQRLLGWLILVTVALAAMAGCGTNDAAPTQQPAPTTIALASFTPTATATPDAATTLEATPTASVTLAPTATATASPVAFPLPAETPTPTPTQLPSTVTIGGVVFGAEVVQTPAERTRGLSYREGIDPMTGMLFVFETPRIASFWMKEMRFPLDFIWIGEDCTVVDTTLNVPHPAPGTPDSALPTYRPAAPVAYNFEINAGEAEQYGIEVGDRVSFSGFSVSSANGAGC